MHYLELIIIVRGVRKEHSKDVRHTTGSQSTNLSASVVLQKGLDEDGGQLHQMRGESIVHTVTVCEVLGAGLGGKE